MVVVVIACACGPSDEELGEFGDSKEVEYGGCDSLVDDPSCDGLDCATTADAREQLGILLEVVAARGWSDAFTPTSAVFHAEPDTMTVEYFLQVGWFRAPGHVGIHVEGTPLQQQHAYEAELDLWRVPESVVSPEEVTAAIQNCNPELEVDPCYAFSSDFVVFAGTRGEDECPSFANFARVDAVTGELLECQVDEPAACEEDGG